MAKKTRRRVPYSFPDPVSQDPLYCQELIDSHLEEGVIEALHALQRTFGCIPDMSYSLLAQSFNMSRAEIYGIKSFYHDFTDQPPGHYVIDICLAESCQACGCQALKKHLEKKLHMTSGSTREDKAYTLNIVYCFGNCALSPNIRVNGKLYGKMTPDQLDRLLGENPS